MITKLFVLLLVFPFFTSFYVKQENRQKTMLLVLAHPDDEMAIAEVLIKFHRQGYKVILMIATDGRYGTRVTKIPDGDSLAKVRREESICSSEKMGIEHPIFLSIDRLDTKNGVRSYFNAHKQLRDSLIKRISSINPDFIITFGPDGDSHHAEHIVVGSAVTEILLLQGWVDKYPLYYIAYTDSSSGLEELGYMDSKYINVEVSYSQEEELIGLEANKCFVSQQTVAEMEDDRASKLRDTVNKALFRKFAVKLGKQASFN
jgi:N-acetylglucosamine malate deacetylase 2